MSHLFLETVWVALMVIVCATETVLDAARLLVKGGVFLARSVARLRAPGGMKRALARLCGGQDLRRP